MGRVENIFGPRTEWGKGNERERVKKGRERAKAGTTPPPTSLRSAASPGEGDKKKSGGGKQRGERPVQKALREHKAAMPGISGFVSIRCGGCRRIINTCLHEKRTVFNCQSCGHSTRLEGLKSIHMKCPRCGFKGNYRTNRAVEEIQMECLNCSLPVNFRRNAKGDFVPEVEE